MRQNGMWLQSRGKGGSYMPQYITSQCVKPAGQRADERDGAGKVYGLNVLEVVGTVTLTGASVQIGWTEKTRDKEEGWSVGRWVTARLCGTKLSFLGSNAHPRMKSSNMIHCKPSSSLN